jgi:sporulation protein YlmC with PRC-barrel domain
MAHISINESDDWHVEHDRQDIRGWTVQDAEGTRLGHVRDLIADTNREMVQTLVLDDGQEIPAENVHLDYDDKVVVLSDTGTYSEATIKQRGDAPAEDFAGLEPAFRKHHRETYAHAEGDYGHYHPAYRLGYDYATDTQYRDRSWEDLKMEMRSDYEHKHGEGTWSRVKDAVHHAFKQARSKIDRQRTS